VPEVLLIEGEAFEQAPRYLDQRYFALIVKRIELCDRQENGSPAEAPYVLRSPPLARLDIRRQRGVRA